MSRGKVSTEVEGKTKFIEHIPSIQIGFRLHRRRVLDSSVFLEHMVKFEKWLRRKSKRSSTIRVSLL